MIRSALEFYEFLSKHFEKIQKIRNQKSNGKCNHFKQDCFFTTNINRTKELQGVTIKETQSFFSIRSTGKAAVVEARHVACLCNPCLSGGQEGCPNIAYAGAWTPFDLKTWKKVTNMKYKNKHWPLNCSNSHKKHEKFANEKHVNIPQPQVNIPQPQVNIPTVFDYSQYISDMQACTSFYELLNYVQNQPYESLKVLQNNPQKMQRCHRTDPLAMAQKPREAPKKLLPIRTYGDGNCLPRAISKAVTGVDDHYKIVRAELIREAVLNMERYFDEEYLMIGAKNKHCVPTAFAQQAECIRSFDTTRKESKSECKARFLRISRLIYKDEMFLTRKSGEYMGMWHLVQTANILHRPVHVVFPYRGSEDYRNDCNRTVYPFEEQNRSREGICIMWTPMVVGSDCVNNFVPMMKS